MRWREDPAVIEEAEAYAQSPADLLAKAPPDMTDAELHRAVRLKTGAEASRPSGRMLPSADALIADVERVIAKKPEWDAAYDFEGGWQNGDGRPIALDFAIMRLLQEIRDELRRR